MANDSGNSMQLQKLGRQSLPLANTPVIQAGADLGAARSLFSIGDVLRHMSGRIEERLDVQAEVEGRAAGTAAGQQGTLPPLMDDGTIRGRAFNASAKDAAITRIDLQSRLRLSEIEAENGANPQGFRTKADAYLQGVMGELAPFDPALAQRYEADFRLRADGAQRRLEREAQAVARDRMLEDALRLQQAAAGDIAQDASNLFDGGPEGVQEGIARMMTGAVRLVDVANQIGPDGQPLFSARERIAFEQKAEATVAEQVALGWMGRQENILDAWQAWKKGEASIAVADAAGNKADVPLRTLLGERAYQMAEGAFMERLRGQLALDAQIDGARDRAFKQTSDEVSAEYARRAQDGQLTLQMVEDARGHLESEEYVKLRALAKAGGATVSDGGTLAALKVADVNGENIKGQLLTALQDQKISVTDFNKLYDDNSKRLQTGLRDPVSAGRDTISNSVRQVLSVTGLNEAPQIAVAGAQAEADYEIMVARFQAKNGYPPNREEAQAIASQVLRHVMPASLQTVLDATPAPMYLQRDINAAGRITPEQFEAAGTETARRFMQKHNGNASAVQADPEYQQEMKRLQDLKKNMSLQEFYLNETR